MYSPESDEKKQRPETQEVNDVIDTFHQPHPQLHSARVTSGEVREEQVCPNNFPLSLVPLEGNVKVFPDT
jgi:hypothetical protein